MTARVAVALAGLAAVTACSVKRTETHTEEHSETVEVTTTKLADNQRLEHDLLAQWSPDVGPIRELTCPGPIPLRVGQSFRCTFAVGDARAAATVTFLTVTDAGDATWKFKFDGDWFLAPMQARIVAQTLAAQLGAEPAVDCGASRAFGADDSPTCTVIAADGRRALARFKLIDGQVRWKLEG